MISILDSAIQKCIKDPYSTNQASSELKETRKSEACHPAKTGGLEGLISNHCG